MTVYGITATGFVLKPLDVILSEIEADQLSEIGPALNIEADAVIGQINGIFSAKLAEAWECLQAVYASQYPDSAAGVPLDNVASISGVTRLPATKSAVTVTLTGTPATVIPAGRVLSVDPAGDRFVLLEDATIPGGGSVDAVFEAEEFGPVRANSGTLTEIETPAVGWASATNADDALLGRNVETDENLRTRRILALAQPASATADAIRSEVLDVDGVTTASVYENNTEITDGEGRPMKSVEVVVEGGTDEEVAQAIFESKASGIRAYGTTDSEDVEDSIGTIHEIGFTRPTSVVILTEAEILFEDTVPLAEYPDRIDAIKVALADYLDALPVGADVVRNRLFAPIYAAVEGIADVTILKVARFGDPLGTANLTISRRERATGDTSDMDVYEA